MELFVVSSVTRSKNRIYTLLPFLWINGGAFGMECGCGGKFITMVAQ